MQIVQIYMHNMLRNFNYIIYSEKSKEAIFVDPLDIDITLTFAKQLDLIPKYLINTHYHSDHMRDNEKFLKISGTQHLQLKDKEFFQLTDSEKIQALDTPGHVKGHQCFLIWDQGVNTGLISGDALFNAGVGNCKNGGDVHEHFHTIYEKLRCLNDNVTIYPSHDYLLNNLEFAFSIDPTNEAVSNLIGKRKLQNMEQEFIATTIGIEKKINPFFRLAETALVQKFPGSLEERFIQIRKLRDNW